MKKFYVVLAFFFGLGAFGWSQESQTQPREKEKKEILFFSNNGCGKCETSQTFFKENKMPYTKYLVKENRPLMYQYVHQKTKGQNVGIGYPVIVYGDSIYFSINNIHTTLQEIKQLMISDGIIDHPESN